MSGFSQLIGPQLFENLTDLCSLTLFFLLVYIVCWLMSELVYQMKYASVEFKRKAINV